MISRHMSPHRQGRRYLTALATLSLISGLVLSGGTALALTQDAFELDKNATNDLSTEHLATLKSTINSTATSFVACERQFDITNDGVSNPVDVVIPAVPFTIQIDAERLTVTALGNPSNKTGGCGFSDPADSTNQVRTWTVTRHVGGTTAAAHSGGSDVTYINTAAADGDDWDQVYSSVTADANDEGDDDTCLALGATECAWTHDTFNVSVFTTGGSKDDLNINPVGALGEAGTGWKWTDSSVPPSDEILDAFAAKYTSDGHELLFFGADRWATVGAKDFGFWFFHDEVGLNPDGTFSGNHTRPDPNAGTRGDILMLGTFSQGGAVTTLRVFEWVGAGGNTNGTLQSLGTFGDCAAGGGSAEGCSTVNNTTVPSPWPYLGAASGIAANQFYAGALLEGGIDLTELGLEGCFASFMAETRSSPEPGAQLKDFSLGSFESCESDLTTTPKNGTGDPLAADSDSDGVPEITIGAGNAGVNVKDSALLDVSGTNTFTGTLSFFICGPLASGTCETGGVPAGSQAVTTNGTYLSDAVNLTSVGTYCWRGEFDSTTNGVDDDSDSSTGECFEVMPRQTALDTAAVASPIVLGNPVQDNATLSNTANQPGSNGGFNGTYTTINATDGAPAGGKITFTLLKADCSTLATGTGTNPQDFTPIAGDGTYGPVSFTPNAVGTYHWQAVYTPAATDPNNLGSSHNAACDDTDETVIVIGTANLSTAQDWLPNDTATLTGDTNLTGTLTFTLYNDLTCGEDGGTVQYTETVPVSDAASGSTFSTDNDSVKVSATGSYSWLVSYDDVNLTDPDDDCETTALDINN